MSPCDFTATMKEPKPAAMRPTCCFCDIETSRMKKVRMSVIMSQKDTMYAGGEAFLGGSNLPIRSTGEL